MTDPAPPIVQHIDIYVDARERRTIAVTVIDVTSGETYEIALSVGGRGGEAAAAAAPVDGEKKLVNG